MISALARQISGVRICTGRALDAPLRREIGHRLEGLDVFRPAVRIAGIVHRVHARVDEVRVEHLGPGEREGEEHRVARRHVGDRNAGARRLRHGDRAIGQRRAAERAEIDAQDAVLARAERRGDLRRGVELGAMALAVVEAERVAVETVAARAMARQVAESMPPESSTTARGGS